jgi:hypothetical protein
MKILKWTPYPADRGPSAFQGTFTLQVPQWHNLIVEEMSYFKKGDNRWVSFPARSYQGQDGQKKYFHYARFEDRQTQYDFSHAVCKALDAYIATLGPSVFAAPSPVPESPPQAVHIGSGPVAHVKPEAEDELPF